MSAKDCIVAKAKAGKVDRDKAARLGDLYDELELRARGGIGPSAAADQAALDTLAAALRQLREKKRRVFHQLRVQEDITARAAALPGKVNKAMLSVLDFDPTGEIAGPNVAIQTQVARGRAQASMVDFIEKFRSKSAGLRRRKAGMANIVRELFGENSGDAEARALAGGIGEGQEYLRKSFNAAGGAIPKRADWGTWQTHNRRLVAASSADEWVDFVAPRLRREKMIDLDTGLAMTEGKLRRLLRDEIYPTIATNGLNKIQPGGFAQASIVNRRQESRFLVFRDADAWLEYQERFGDGDIFTSIMGNVEAMARDVGVLQVLGPSPNTTLRFMEGLVDKATAETALKGTGKKAARASGRVFRPKVALRDTFNVVTGALNAADNQTFANVSAAIRNITSSAMLGGAFFSALSDRTFSNITAHMNGIPAARTLARHLKLFAPGSKADQKQAVRLGFGAQGWSSMAIAQERYLGEVVGPVWSQRIADTVLRASLLSPWTQAGRWGFSTEMLGFITEQVAKPLGELPDALRASFARHGIGGADWDLLRKTPLWRDPETGAEFLRPQDIVGALDEATADTALFGLHQRLADRLQAMVLTETEFAVPSTTARVRAILTGGTQPGTLWGEITRNVALFKSFPVTLAHTHLQRAATRQGGVSKAKYVAHLFIGTAIMGALGTQLSEISKGRDPIEMNPFGANSEIGAKFWLKAAARGGGFGIFGDFLFSEGVNRYGGGIAQTLLGPVLGSEVPAAQRLTVGNLQELLAEGEAKGAGREIVQFVKLMMPGRSLWYTQLALERLVFDELQKMVDPDAAARFRRIERKRKRETGQRFFAPPGRGFPPRRGPDVGKALGQ